MIGFIVMGLILVPVVGLIAVAVLDPPRTFRIPGLFLGSLVLQIAVIIASFAMFGVLLRFIIPG